MKKCRKFLSILCALCVVMSMAVPALAASSDSTYMPVDGDIITATGPDGIEYDLTVEVVELIPVENVILPMWSDDVISQTIPKNIDGNQGAVIGSYSYRATSSDVNPGFFTYNWSSNLSSINVSITDYTSGIIYWGTVYSAGSYTYSSIDLTSGHYYYYMTSGQMNDSSTSGTADFSLFSTVAV